MKILDEFTNRNISRQRKMQLRRQRDGLCIACGSPAAGGTCHCLKHLVKIRKYFHKKQGCKRRNNCLSRKLEKAARKST